MTGGALVQPNPSVQSFKIVIKNDQKMCINERFTGIMIAKGHVSPFAKKDNRPEPMIIEAEEPTRSRRTSIMSDMDTGDRAGDAIDGAFKRALKQVAPMADLAEADEERSETSIGSSHKSTPSLASSVQSHGSSHVSHVSSTVSSHAASGISDVPSQASGTTISSMPSIRSQASLLTDITTQSERSTNTTSTTSNVSTVTKLQNAQIKTQLQERMKKMEDEKLENEKLANLEDEKMELESEAGLSIMTSLSEINSTITSKKGDKME